MSSLDSQLFLYRAPKGLGALTSIGFCLYMREKENGFIERRQKEGKDLVYTKFSLWLLLAELEHY